MFANCNVIELDTEASQFVEGKVKAKEVGKLFSLVLLEGLPIMASVTSEKLLT